MSTNDNVQNTASTDLPVACSLTPDTIAARKADLLPGLVRRASAREESACGVRLRFPAEALATIASTIEVERQCCRFLRFEVIVEPDGGPVWLSLSGPPGTREFLAALIDA
jgi:hypothetical protein